MELIRFRPLVLTFLLLLVYGNASLFLTTLSFISISIIATFVCFIFKIQVDFERLFSFIEALWNFKARAVTALKWDAIDYKSNDGKPESTTPRMVYGGTLKDLPRPIARKLKLIIDGVMNEFVASWYTQICPEDQQFTEETRRALEQIAVEGYRRLCNVDTHSAAVHIINLVTGHLKIFNDCRDAVNSKYPGINATDFERCITELYEIRINQHISSKSQGTSLDYLRKITDILLYILVPQSAFSCEGGRFMLREILAIQGLQRLVDLLSDPHFVNEALIDIFEEPVPKEVILRQWDEEASRELISDDENDDSKDKLDDKSTNGFGSKTVDSDIYESASEMDGGGLLGNHGRTHRRTITSSYSSIEHLNAASDIMESKFATPRHSTTEWSSADESYNAFDRVLRQNQLEARSSAPVYGSTMVKLHGKSDPRPISSNVHFHIPVSNHLTNTLVAKADSGIYSETVRIRSSSAPLSQVDEVTEKKKERKGKRIKLKLKHHKKAKKQNSESMVNNDMQSQVISLTEDNTLEPWNSCPPPGSSYYHKISCTEMDRRQDLISEKVKARLHALGSGVKGISCLTSVTEKEQLCKRRSLPDLKNSFESSMVICQFNGYGVYIENDKNKKREYIVLNEDREEFVSESVKVHCIPERNAFYELAPDCPTCIEMTSLASPKINGRAVLTYDPKHVKLKPPDHECGLSISHFYHPELEETGCFKEDDDKESFISFDSGDSSTDLEDSHSTIASESTLLASVESTALDESCDLLVKRPKSKRPSSELKSSSVGSFEVMSLKESDSEYSSITDFSEDGLSQASFDSKKNVNETVIHGGSRVNCQAPSITTFASAFDSSTHEVSNNHHQYLKPNTNSNRTHQTISSIVKQFRSPINFNLKKGKPPKISSKILKSLKKLRLKAQDTWKDESSDEDANGSLQIPHHQKQVPKRKRAIAKRFDLPLEQNLTHDEIGKRNIESSFSGTTDSDKAGTNNYRTDQSNLDEIVSQWHRDALESNEDMVEEVADEVLEEADCSESFYDAKSLFGATSDASDRLAAGPLDTGRKHKFGEGLSVVAGDDDEQNADDIDNKCDDDQLEMKENFRGDWVIPIYDGEAMLPHAGKAPVSAWMYPIQMISIPSTEVAFEKRWEPGGNKYTLYSIHYDIRIWPEIYKHQMLEASQRQSTDGDPSDGIPLIREIKRRYREFMYLHNRLTHSQMSGCMKNVLRPNRRYAMPFGRMDPDVIEGRRKILETYLVSLVSRPEVCNSREFKEFLGAEGYGSVSVVKQKLVQPKQMVNKVIGNIKSAFPAPRDVAEKGESFQYFIRGYDVPRMFGYAKERALDRNSSPWFSSFVEIQENREMLPDGEKSSNSKKSSVIGRVEFFQKPRFIGTKPRDLTVEGMTDSPFSVLGPRSSGDGSDCPAPCQDELFTESPDRRFSVGIPALFTNQFAARSQNETLSTLDARKADEDIPWPLSDAVMSFLCQGLKGYDCWLTYENFQQALLYSLGGVLEWKISREIDEIVIEERWMKYLNDLYHVIWQDGKLIEPKPEPTEEEKNRAKDAALEKMLDFFPSIVRVIIGSNEYKQWGEGLLHALQYKKINRHLLFAAIDMIMCEFIPELQDGFPRYKSASNSST